MKKNLIFTFFVVLGFAAISNAQFGASAGLLYGTETELGFTGRVNYDINDKISVFAGYSLLDSESESGFSLTLSSLDFDVHYHFSSGSTKPYALAGINITRATAKVLGISQSSSETGFNIGGGVLHGLSDKFSLFGEAKYVISDADQLVITAGVHYAF